MKRVRLLLFMVLWIAVTITSGCAPPEHLKPEKINAIKKVAIVTFIPKQAYTLLDHTKSGQDTFTGNLNPMKGPVEKEVLSTETSQKIRGAVNGDPDIIFKKVKYFNISAILDEKIVKKISRYDTIGPYYFNNKKIKEPAGYFKHCRRNNADILLMIEYAYGLAVYEKEKPGAAIDAQVLIYDVATQQLLLKKVIQSDAVFKKSRTVSDFAANKAALFKKDITSAAEAVSLLISKEISMP